MRLEITSRENLAQLLSRAGYPLELRCGGLGRCGRCMVHLVSGAWSVRNRRVEAPADVPACQTALDCERGEVEFSFAQQSGQIADRWHGEALPATDAPVIGIDLGTTTVAAAKAVNGIVVARSSAFNGQMKFGDNVLTRIDRYAREPEQVRTALWETAEKLLAQLGTENLRAIGVAGNTVISSIFHGIDPAPIGRAPFLPSMRHFSLIHWHNIPLYTVPCISGFVGGDLTAGLAECRLKPGEMLVDIGTNCEMIFASPQGMICTSAAAGGAFEGAGISCGGRAEYGAVDHYFAPNRYSVLGGGAPRKICGSALIDFLAVESSIGRIDRFGRLHPSASQKEIAPGLAITEEEIAELLKAKAAVFAGIRTLEEHCRCEAKKIYLAGGFAQYLDLHSAIAIGMLPQRDYEIVGNTSLAGALRLASQPERMAELEALSNVPEECPLNTLPGFEKNFIDALLLPQVR